MNVLITGGTGFIGRHVALELSDRGHNPIIFDRHTHPNTRWETHLGDIRDATAVTEAAAHSHAIMHLAGVLGTQETIDNPYPAAETNILGGLNVLNAIRQYRLPAVYICVGNHWMNNTYSITKTTVERFCHMYNTEHGTKIRIVRALNAYGPGQSLPAPYGNSTVRKIMPSFITRALTHQPIEIYGDGTQIMDMIYVDDVAKILCDALFSPHIPDHVYEAGTGRETTVLEIAQTIIRQTGGTITHLPMRPGEPPHSKVVAHPLTLEPLGWAPSRMVTLENGINHTIDYIRGHIQ